MSGTLVHRGPDSFGEFSDGDVALAARRLSIIDLETGDQPIANEDGTLHVVQNGEIYNYRELRHELERAGHHFRTHGDTEVLLHLYEEHGDTVRRAPARDVRRRDLGRAPAAARARAGPLRDQAALLPCGRRRARVRLRAAGASPRGDRPRRARGVPRFQCHSRTADHLQGGAEASRRPCARLGRRPRRHPAVRSPGAERGSARRRRGRARRGAALPSARLGPGAPGQRRPRRRPALRRRGFGLPRGARRGGELGAAAHVLDRVRGALVRRARGCAARRGALRHAASRAGAAARRRAAPTCARRRVRRAVRRLVGAADVSGLATGRE